MIRRPVHVFDFHGNTIRCFPEDKIFVLPDVARPYFGRTTDAVTAGLGKFMFSVGTTDWDCDTSNLKSTTRLINVEGVKQLYEKVRWSLKDEFLATLIREVRADEPKPAPRTQMQELQAKGLGVFEAQTLLDRELMRRRIQSATTIEEIKLLLLDMNPEIPRPR